MSHVIPNGQSSGQRNGQSRLSTVKYSLAELLAEVEIEKVSGCFGQEKLQQSEITKTFQPQQTPRRRVSSSN